MTTNQGAGSNGAYVPYSDGDIYENFGSTGRKDEVDAGSLNFADWHIYPVYSKANDSGIYANGAQVYQTSSNTVGFSSSYKFGRGNEGTPLQAGVKSILMFTAKTTTPERTLLHAEL